MQIDSTKPKWKPSAFRAVVKLSAQQLGIRNTAVPVLFALLDVINYSTGLARTGTPKLCEKVGRSERAVKTALQQLREAGLIYWQHRAGGGKTALYGFRYTREAVIAYNERGAIFAPLIVGEYWVEGCNSFQKGVQKTQIRSANIAPPSPMVNNSKAISETASRGQGDKAFISVGNVFTIDGSRARIAELCSNGMGYGEARAIVQKEALRAAEN